ncbi:hypothetical protein TWF696_003804 [Orbilia brochopaga]|uniref:F-box domain-containing protein n=1 Tax=Orbilia brochopaga TaxID=3140254 RepID=A0AAV9V5F3_9PEZI
MATRTTLPLPTELCDAVLEYLPYLALYSFSLCSKRCHELAVPFIFRSIRFGGPLTPLRTDGGVLFSRLKYVRHLWFGLPPDDLIPVSQDEKSEFNISTYFMENFTLFTEFLLTAPVFPLTSLELHFTGDEQLEINLFDAALSRLAQSRVYATIKRLSILFRRSFLLPLCRQFMTLEDGVSPYEVFLKRRPDVLGQPLTLSQLCKASIQGILTTPPSLTEAVIRIIRWPAPQAYYCYYFASCPTLKKLTIDASQLFPDNSQGHLYYSKLLSFPAVTHLNISIAIYPPVDELAWISVHFPRLEILEVENHKQQYSSQSSNVGVLQDAHDGILGMRTLRELVLPWPRIRRPTYGIPPPLIPGFTPEHIEKFARHLWRSELEVWMARWRDRGIQLQIVVFCGHIQTGYGIDYRLGARCEIGIAARGRRYTFSWTGSDISE